MPMRAGRRPDLGERISPGEVRPVTNRLLLQLTAGVVALVAIGIAIVLLVSAGTKTPKPPATNVPSGTHSPHAAAAITAHSFAIGSR